MKGAKSLLCGFQRRKVKGMKKPHFARQLSTYSYVLSGYSLENACGHGDLKTVLEILDSMPYSSSEPKLALGLSRAAQAGHQDIVRALLDVGADPNETDQKGMTPLMHASHLGHLGVVKVLLDSGSSLIDFQYAAAEDEGTALHYACRSGHEDIIRILLDAGADPDAHYPGQESPLTLCAHHPQDLFSVIQTLVHKGADVNYCPDHAMPALHRVALRRCPDTTVFLLENGANLHHWVSFNGPVLHRIAADKLSANQCFCNTEKTIKALIDYNSVDMNCPVSGATPLLCAVRRGNVDCIRTLLKLNADPDIRNKQGNTPVQLALSNDIPYKTKIVQMLMKAECSLTGAPTTATTYDIFTHDDEIYQEVKIAKSNPKNLKRQCRRVIRRTLGCHIEQKLSSLDLEEDLKAFLLLSDIPDSGCICEMLAEQANSAKITGITSRTSVKNLLKKPVVRIKVDVEEISVDENGNHKALSADMEESPSKQIVPAIKVEDYDEESSEIDVSEYERENSNLDLEASSSRNQGVTVSSKDKTKLVNTPFSLPEIEPEMKVLTEKTVSKCSKEETASKCSKKTKPSLSQSRSNSTRILRKSSNEKFTGKSPTYSSSKKSNLSAPLLSRLGKGLLLAGENGLSFNKHEAAAQGSLGRPRVASAGMIDLLQVGKPKKFMSRSASNSSKALNKVNQSQEKKQNGLKKDKSNKKQEYIVVKFY